MLAISPEVHKELVRKTPAQLAEYLLERLGQKLTAVLIGVADAKAIGHWAKGERTPQPASEKRLRDAAYLVGILSTQETTQTIRSWLLGMNPYLDDQAPANVFGKDFPGVLAAAKAFLADV